MSRERAKGTWYEGAVCAYLGHVLGARTNRLGMGGTRDVGDVHVDGLDVTIECKNCQRMQLGEWVDEAVRESENAGTRMGVVVHHRKGCGTALIADSYVTMRLGDFAALLLMILRREYGMATDYEEQYDRVVADKQRLMGQIQVLSDALKETQHQLELARVMVDALSKAREGSDD